MTEFFLVLLFGIFRKGGPGAVAGAVAGTVLALAETFLPVLRETGKFCEDWDSCAEALTLVVVVGAIVGAVLGALAGFAGRKVATWIYGAQKEQAGAIIGGSVGGAAPWLVSWAAIVIRSVSARA